MSFKRLKKVHPAWWISLGFIIVALLYVRFVYFVYDWVMTESRDYALMDQLNVMAADLQQYKQSHGSYPENLMQAGISDEYCSYTFNVKKCAKILYKPSFDLQDFKMVSDAYPLSGGWAVLFFSPHFSVTRERMNNHPGDEYNQIREKYGTYCWFCAAYKTEEERGSDTVRPVYKKDSKIFSNPNEWPDLP